MKRDFATQLEDYVRSGHAMLACTTHEIDRALDEIIQVAKRSDRKLFVWSIATGWIDEQNAGKSQGMPDADRAIQEITNLSPDEPAILVLKNFGCYLHHTTCGKFDIVLGWLEEVKPYLFGKSQTIIFLGPEFKEPTQLRHDVTQIEFKLPDDEAIHATVEKTLAMVQGDETKKGKAADTSNLPEIVRACKGMTHQQIGDRVALALRVHKKLDHEAARLILNEKANVVARSGILKYYEPPDGGLSTIGGLAHLKEYLMLDQPCFTPEAMEFGIEFPKGILMVGVPGGGKTLSSIAVASLFGYPLIQLDIGNLMNSLVGESEANLREAIHMVESIAPCVLQLDEVEKGFAGGALDGGTSQRMFGTFIKWLNDRTAPVYVVATANTMHLPPEFARKGRFDEIFFVDLPEVNERAEIARIHLGKRKRDPNKFDLEAIVEATSEFTGADIEQAVKTGLKLAFSQKKELATDHVVTAAKSIVPLNKTEPDRIKEIREWGKNHAKPANKAGSGTPPRPPLGRKIEVRRD